MSANRSRLVFWLKVGIWIGVSMPLGFLVYRLFTGGYISDDPVEQIQHQTGNSILILLFMTLSITPARRLTGWNPLIRFRRLLGLFAFFYACLHAFSYFVFDQGFSATAIAVDVTEHPWVLVGFSAFCLLIPLAVTSTNWWIRRLGGKRWSLLHRLVYPVAVLGVLHFYWLVKIDDSEPIIYAFALAGILSVRFMVRNR